MGKAYVLLLLYHTPDEGAVDGAFGFPAIDFGVHSLRSLQQLRLGYLKGPWSLVAMLRIQSLPI